MMTGDRSTIWCCGGCGVEMAHDPAAGRYVHPVPVEPLCRAHGWSADGAAPPHGTFGGMVGVGDDELQRYSARTLRRHLQRKTLSAESEPAWYDQAIRNLTLERDLYLILLRDGRYRVVERALDPEFRFDHEVRLLVQERDSELGPWALAPDGSPFHTIGCLCCPETWL